VLVLGSVAAADNGMTLTSSSSLVNDSPARCTPFTHRWPELPADPNLSLEDQITDHLSELGNMIGGHMNLLSDHLLAVSVDGRHNRAHLLLGGGNAHYLTFKVDSDWLFSDGKAHVKARLELGVAGHQVELRLPDMDVIPDNYHGQDLVQVNVSVLERRF
jgi:hypothetical protein